MTTTTPVYATFSEIPAFVTRYMWYTNPPNTNNAMLSGTYSTTDQLVASVQALIGSTNSLYGIPDKTAFQFSVNSTTAGVQRPTGTPTDALLMSVRLTEKGSTGTLPNSVCKITGAGTEWTTICGPSGDGYKDIQSITANRPGGYTDDGYSAYINKLTRATGQTELYYHLNTIPNTIFRPMITTTCLGVITNRTGRPGIGINVGGDSYYINYKFSTAPAVSITGSISNTKYNGDTDAHVTFIKHILTKPPSSSVAAIMGEDMFNKYKWRIENLDIYGDYKLPTPPPPPAQPVVSIASLATTSLIRWVNVPGASCSTATGSSVGTITRRTTQTWVTSEHFITFIEFAKAVVSYWNSNLTRTKGIMPGYLNTNVDSLVSTTTPPTFDAIFTCINVSNTALWIARALTVNSKVLFTRRLRLPILTLDQLRSSFDNLQTQLSADPTNYDWEYVSVNNTMDEAPFNHTVTGAVVAGNVDYYIKQTIKSSIADSFKWFQDLISTENFLFANGTLCSNTGTRRVMKPTVGSIQAEGGVNGWLPDGFTEANMQEIGMSYFRSYRGDIKIKYKKVMNATIVDTAIGLITDANILTISLPVTSNPTNDTGVACFVFEPLIKDCAVTIHSGWLSATTAVCNSAESATAAQVKAAWVG